MGVIEWAVGFGTFILVCVALTMGLEYLSPGMGLNPIASLVIAAAAGWGVTKVFGE